MLSSLGPVRVRRGFRSSLERPGCLGSQVLPRPGRPGSLQRPPPRSLKAQIRAGGAGRGESVYQGETVSVQNDEKVLDVGGGEGWSQGHRNILSAMGPYAKEQN